LAKALSEENLNEWLSAYTIDTTKSKNIALILAGNIPLVFMTSFSVLISGHSVLIKTSSNDQLTAFS
jgi:hypothetical protein